MRTILLLLWFGLLAFPFQAQADDRVALVIGNSNYRHVSKLPNAIRDAELLGAALRSTGFHSVTVKTDLTREQTMQAVQEFAGKADDADWAVIYYAGHAVESNGMNYIVPVEARLKRRRDIELETVDLGKMLNAIADAKRLRLILFDAARNDPFARSAPGETPPPATTAGGHAAQPAGTLFVYATRPGELALDGPGPNSPFAEALAKRIQQKPGLELRRVIEHVRDDVMRSTQNKQQPQSSGTLSASDDFHFDR